MKKVLFFAAALVAMVACNKTESSVNVSNPEEINFFSMTQNATRGYITGTVFSDIANPDCRDYYNSTVAPDSAYRTMIVSAYNATDKEDYFTGCEFKANKGVKDDSDHKAIWHASPVKYWPIGKSLEFLTYSSKNITPTYPAGSKARADVSPNWDGAKKVSFDVTPEQCYQNDIVYAQASGNNRGTAPDSSSQSDKGLSIQYFHSQAWLTFNVTVVGKDSTLKTDSAKVKVDKIVLENVYNSGVLTFEYDDTKASSTKQPKATWNFFTQNPTDVEVDDPWGVLHGAAPLGTTASDVENGLLYAKKYVKPNLHGTDASKDYNGFQLNMLMPAQKHNDFVLYYTMNEKQNSVVLPFTKGDITGSFDDGTVAPDKKSEGAKKGEWVMGFHYIYNITIEINELTFAPTVKAWVDVTGFNPSTQAL